VNGGPYKKTIWTPAPNGAQPGQIAQFGHLQSGQSVALTDTAITGKGQCVANVQVYLALQVQAGGDTVRFRRLQPRTAPIPRGSRARPTPTARSS
jgi:hypothetical protein